MPPLYVTTQGAKLRLRRRRLIVEKQAANDQPAEQIASVPLVHVDQVILFGNIGLTTPIMTELMRRNLPVVFMTVGGRYKGRLIGEATGFGGLRLVQYNRAQDPEAALALARQIVYGKLRNQRALLLRYGRRRADDILTESAARVEGLAGKARRCQTLNSLNGCEGKAGAIYFGVFKRLLKHDWPFEKRVRRADVANEDWFDTSPLKRFVADGMTFTVIEEYDTYTTLGVKKNLCDALRNAKE